MQILISDQKQIRKAREFLGAIVVNKALFWPLHFATHLEKMQRIGIRHWQQSQNGPHSEAWAKRKSKQGISSEMNVFSGGTKSQATFQAGDAEIHITGRGNIYVNLQPADWKPIAKEPDWKSKYNDRPFWYLNKLKDRSFWRPGTYIDLAKADKTIWKSSLPEGEVDIKDAQKMLLMTVAMANKILRGNGRIKYPIGSWNKGKPKGACARWR